MGHQLGLLAVVFAVSACASREPGLADIEARLRQVPEWPPGASMPDAHGTVVLRVDDRVAVRLDDDSPDIEGIASMAIFTDRYKGEIMVLEVFQRHALGRIAVESWAVNHGFGGPEERIRVGDRASCKTP